ncbi:MAG: glycosyltransferase family 2 protein [Lachnospiraceae bacterium]
MSRYEKKLVSVIMPTYNCADYIGETIESVQAQTYKYWELIIVDDNSTDDTWQIVEEYCETDSRIKYKRLKENSGAAIARTEAMKLAEGQYIAFCDSDDLWMPEKLERQLIFMRETGHVFTCTAYMQIDEKGVCLNRVFRPRKKCGYNRLLLDCPVGNSTVIYDASVMGKFDVPNIRKRNDDALWLEMLKKEKYIWGMNDVLMKYRVRSDGISGNKLRVIKYHWILYRDIEHLSVIRSLFHIIYWCVIKVLRIK